MNLDTLGLKLHSPFKVKSLPNISMLELSLRFNNLVSSEPQDGVQPWFITKPQSSTTCLGQHALVSCAIAGDPFPAFLWMKNGQVISAGGDFEILQKEDVVSLLIRKVKTHHAGNYEIHLKYGFARLPKPCLKISPDSRKDVC